MAVTGNVNISTITRLELFEEWFKLMNLKRKDSVSGLLEAIFTGTNVSGHNIEGILENFIKNIEILPIGQLGEEAQEAKNKDFKFIREHRSLQEKCSKKLRLDPEALQMLKAPKIRSNTNSDSE